MDERIHGQHRHAGGPVSSRLPRDLDCHDVRKPSSGGERQERRSSSRRGGQREDGQRHVVLAGVDVAVAETALRHRPDDARVGLVELLSS
ncbi:hypothetical protein [Actinophytocola gossypii]|uniref:Uncharacterized protein n=1 Tax=Actinophytocola gossypii TaxID=2812003 RepID=A0ABT2J5W1_9PSEU|nr:hypothetical protein [Actinophytocola gossypii]MCT2583156.1 hypothetical protein [Actinophytocola gossypii]